MKPIKVTKAVKMTILGLFLGLVVLSGALLVLKQTQKAPQVALPTLQYAIQADAKASIKLKPNATYMTNTLPIDHPVVGKLVDRVSAQLDLKLKATENAEIKGTLKRVVHVKSLYGEKGEVLFDHKQILSTTVLEGMDSLTLSDAFEDDLGSSRAYLAKAFEETQIEPGSIVEMGWEYSGVIIKGQSTLPFEGEKKVLLPLTLGVFKGEMKTVGKMTGNSGLPKPTASAGVTLKALSATALLALMVIGGLGALASVWILKTPEKKSGYELELDHIFNLHGDRLARLEKSLHNQHANIINVTDIEDLIKISDEIRQPIFYFRVEEEDEGKIEFYVFDEIRIYYLVKFEISKSNISSFIRQIS